MKEGKLARTKSNSPTQSTCTPKRSSQGQLKGSLRGFFVTRLTPNLKNPVWRQRSPRVTIVPLRLWQRKRHCKTLFWAKCLNNKKQWKTITTKVGKKHRSQNLSAKRLPQGCSGDQPNAAWYRCQTTPMGFFQKTVPSPGAYPEHSSFPLTLPSGFWIFFWKHHILQHLLQQFINKKTLSKKGLLNKHHFWTHFFLATSKNHQKSSKNPMFTAPVKLLRYSTSSDHVAGSGPSGHPTGSPGASTSAASSVRCRGSVTMRHVRRRRQRWSNKLSWVWICSSGYVWIVFFGNGKGKNNPFPSNTFFIWYGQVNKHVWNNKWKRKNHEKYTILVWTTEVKKDGNKLVGWTFDFGWSLLQKISSDLPIVTDFSKRFSDSVRPSDIQTSGGWLPRFLSELVTWTTVQMSATFHNSISSKKPEMKIMQGHFCFTLWRMAFVISSLGAWQKRGSQKVLSK